MDAKLKTKWVKALRSGKFKQGDGGLYYDRKYCCLGVLCTVAGIDIKEAKRNRGNVELLSTPVLRKVGLTHNRQQLLARMNDGTPIASPKSFPEIADYIEKNL